MGTGLLESLKKHRLENFITEAFAWILKNHSDFSKYFVVWIMAELNMELPEIDEKNCKWITQYNLNKDKVFPDMVCLSNNNAIVFEHKVNADLSDNQLQKYKDCAAKEFGNSKVKVVLITAKSSQHSQNPDLALCWYDIYNLIDDWLQKNTDAVAKFIFKDFLKLLESENLDPGEPISHESIKLYDSFSNDCKMMKNIANLIGRVENEDWSLNIREGYKKFIQEEKPYYKYGKRWGRMGLDLLGDWIDWRPGIFVGILLDAKGHLDFGEQINLEKGPYFCLILDFMHNNSTIKPPFSYTKNKHYEDMVKKLESKVAGLNEGWEFYNHLNDNTIEKKNKDHPIHIRKPMLDVFEGTSTVEEQASIFYKAGNDLVKIVTDEKCFWELREAHRKYNESTKMKVITSRD